MHNNISFFIPHLGCPHCCSFCSQKKISGTEEIPSYEKIRKTCKEALEYIKNPQDTEIAFFGGSFTALPENQMIEFLECVQDFISEDKFFGIRVSTRPDAIDEHICDILEKYHVTSVELGAQSMNDEVLLMNERGHNSKQVEDAAKFLKNRGFSLGLQMMTGLWGSDAEKDVETAIKIAELEPETVRIYPTVVLENTKLGEIFKDGKYKMMSFEEMTELCSRLLQFFDEKNIKVIKCGLHAEKGVEENMIAGYYHPAFREICESLVFRNKMEEFIKNHRETNEFTFYVDRKNVSKAVGQKKSNINYFGSQNVKIKIKGTESEKLSAEESNVFKIVGATGI